MVAIPIAMYASIAWYDRATHTIIKRHLLAAQRALLIMNTQAARTTSTVAMQVIAGAIPFDLVLIERGLKGRVRRNQNTQWNTYSFCMKESRNEVNLKTEYEKIEKCIINNWQQKWEMELHGRQTYQFIKNVEFTKRNSWFKPTRECVYIITGYGPINSTLYKRGATENKICPSCKNKEETLRHVLLECPAYQRLRYEELNNYDTNTEVLINTTIQYNKLRAYAQEVFKIRRTYL